MEYIAETGNDAWSQHHSADNKGIMLIIYIGHTSKSDKQLLTDNHYYFRWCQQWHQKTDTGSDAMTLTL